MLLRYTKNYPLAVDKDLIDTKTCLCGQNRMNITVIRLLIISQSVRVTFESERGASGFKPLAAAKSAANSCPGMI